MNVTKGNISKIILYIRLIKYILYTFFIIEKINSIEEKTGTLN